jgi:hypothetical protein
MTEPIQTTVADAVAAKHDEGTLITLTGIAGLSTFHVTKQDNPWVSGWLYGDNTSVQVQLFPATYRAYEAVLGPTADEYRPPTVTVTGRVIGGMYGQPAVQVLEVVRLSGAAAHGLDHFRVVQERIAPQVAAAVARAES